MIKETVFDLKEYLPIESLADFFEEESKNINKIDSSLDELLLGIKKVKESVSAEKQEIYNFLIRELPYYWGLVQDEFKKSISIESIKQIVDDMPKQKISILRSFLKNKLIALLEINEDLLQSCIFHYSKFKERGASVEKSDIFNVYKNVYITNKNFTLKDVALVISAYKNNVLKSI